MTVLLRESRGLVIARVLCFAVAVHLAGCSNQNKNAGTAPAAPKSETPLERLESAQGSAVYQIYTLTATSQDRILAPAFAISANGLLCTRYSAIRYLTGPFMVRNRSVSGLRISGIGAVDERADLALVQLDHGVKTPNFVELAIPAAVQPGDWLGVLDAASGNLAGALRRRHRTSPAVGVGQMFETDLPAPVGAKGAPVFLSDGRVIGVIAYPGTSVRDGCLVLPAEHIIGLTLQPEYSQPAAHAQSSFTGNRSTTSRIVERPQSRSVATTSTARPGRKPPNLPAAPPTARRPKTSSKPVISDSRTTSMDKRYLGIWQADEFVLDVRWDGTFSLKLKTGAKHGTWKRVNDNQARLYIPGWKAYGYVTASSANRVTVSLPDVQGNLHTYQAH